MSSSSEPGPFPIPPETVREQLQTILTSPVFAAAPRLNRFLTYVVEQSLAGKSGDLKEYRIGVEVFRRPETYDPKVDPVVRVEARQLRFKLAEYYESQTSAAVLISVPKGGYAARFEWRQEGEASVEAPAAIEPAVEASPIPETRVTLLPRVVAATTGVVLLGLLVWYGFSLRQPQAPVGPPSIAVLPFTNLGGDPANEYFTDGLTDEITDALSRSKPLRVIARSSAFQFKGRNVDVREAGRELKVESILTGSVSRAGGRIKVLAQLARASDGSVEWSRRYERPESDLFALQSAIASDIAGSLRLTLVPAATRRTTADARAQDYYMRARYEADQLTRDSLLSAIGNFERAIERDPAYAAAYYGLAVARHRLPAYANDPRLLDRQAIEAAYRKAIELDPNFPEPHTGLALLAAQEDWDWPRAERELEIASSIAPSAMAEGHTALIGLIRGRKGEVAEHIRRARDLDPLGVAILMNTAEIQIMAGDYATARQILERFSVQHPEVNNARLLAALSFLYQGQPEEALTRLRGLESTIPEVPAFEAGAHALAGHKEEALRLLREYEAKPVRSEAAIAAAYGYLKDESNALLWLERSVARREFAGAFMAVHPAFAFLRGKPAFQELARRAGLSL